MNTLLPAIAALTLAAAPALAQDAHAPATPAPPSAANNAAQDEITPALDVSIARALRYLDAQQQTDGSWSGGRFGKNVAITSLACLALMGDGNTPSRGEHARAIRSGLDFVLANAAENGLIAAEAANGPMYGHGFATLFLGEAYGMTAGGGDTALSGRLHETLVKAIRLIERTQNDEGGWRYNPVPYDADVSVTICQVMALRSARNAGIEVKKEVIDKAVDYIRRCQNVDGGFKYQLETGSSAWPRSAAGVASLFYAGIYEDQAIDKGVGYLHRVAKPGTPRSSRAHFFYGHYYAVQAMYLAGGDDWEAWWPAIRQELIEGQLDDGSWEDRTVGPAYATAMSLIILQMPKRYLPIFQK